MKSVMMHLVAGYPTQADTKKLLAHMIKEEVAAVELQIPFSDPIADGPVLMHANDVSVAHGIHIDDVLSLLPAETRSTQIYIMTYIQPIMHYGFDKFFDKASKLNVAGFIIPDLPFDAPEMSQLIKTSPELAQKIVPVLSQGMPDDRLDHLFDVLSPKLVYVTARHGITGDKTADFSSGLSDFIAKIRKLTDTKVALGFGIQTPDDVKSAAKLADMPVVGSAITKTMSDINKTKTLVSDLAAAARMV